MLPDSVWCRASPGSADYWGFVDGRAADLLERESDPRLTIELLPDWERNWGLPDPCYTAPLTIDERQLALVMRMTMQGAQSREFFIGVAAQIGYHITISEYRVWVVGLDQLWRQPRLRRRLQPDAQRVGSADQKSGRRAGSRRRTIGMAAIRARAAGQSLLLTVHVDQAKLVWFRYASGQCGVDPHLRIGLATILNVC